MKTTLIALLVACLGLTAAPAVADQPDPAAAPKKSDVIKIVAAGDSITAGGGASSRRFGWPGRLHRRNLKAIDMVNRGHGSSCFITEGCGYGKRLVDTFDEEVLSENPDVVIVSIGRNDLCHVTTEEYIRAAKALRRKVHAAGAELRFGTITPANERWQWPCEEQAAEINDWLLAQRGTIDFASAVEDSAGQLRRSYDYGDGLHMNGYGYTAMAKAAEEALGLRG